MQLNKKQWDWEHCKPTQKKIGNRTITVVAQRTHKGHTEFLRQGFENHQMRNPLSNYIVRP